MDVEVEAVSNLQLYRAIEEWWGTKYRYGGTTKKELIAAPFRNVVQGLLGNITTYLQETSMPSVIKLTGITFRKATGIF